ncbi:hypothetical protein DFH29DRAFT_1068052 [Suillus ampliporus]|nr:hypothetical protein DFH29DRAFT_1068052 [Suillus ampliporus]
MSTGQTLTQMFLTCTWLEAILYGNLLSSLTGIKFLLFASSLQFALATAHAILAFIQASYFAESGGNAVYIASLSVYAVNAYTQELLLVSDAGKRDCANSDDRAYQRYGDSSLSGIVTSKLHPSTTASLAIVFIAPKNSDVFSHNVRAFSLAAWSFEMILNVTVTGGIAYHLWRSGQQTAILANYKNTILVIVESGALVTSCTCVMFGLFVAGNIVGLIAINITMQVTTMTPLLLIVRISFGLSRSKHPSSSGGLPFTTYSRPSARVNIVHSQNTTSDYPMHVMPKSKDYMVQTCNACKSDKPGV